MKVLSCLVQPGFIAQLGSVDNEDYSTDALRVG
jgi:hypothetical protein